MHSQPTPPSSSALERGSPTRRDFVGGLTTGLVAGLGSQAFAQQEPAAEAPGGRTHGQSQLETPVKAYPKPPFSKQSQEWPGLASRMEPRPDHGEKSYVGTGRLTGRKALITGGDSGIGRAAAATFEKGRDTWIRGD